MRTSVAATASAGKRTGRDFKRPEVRRREAVNVYLKVWKRKEAVLEEGKKTQKSDFFPLLFYRPCTAVFSSAEKKPAGKFSASARW